MNKENRQKGQVIIINTLLFFALSTAIIFAVTSPVISSFNITKSFLKSKQSFIVASSATNEALYKLSAQKTIAPTEVLTLSQGTATTTLTDILNGKKISISSDVQSYKRNYELLVSTGEGISFNYGLQVGQGGFEMSGSSGITGNVYSNGDIIGGNGAYVTGSAVAAYATNPSLALSNSGDINPPAQITFGGSETSQDAAQSFTNSTTSPITSVRILIKKSDSGTMNNITMRIVSNNNNQPSNTTLAQGVISASTITTTFNYVTIPLSSLVSLTSNTKYWLVFDTTTVQDQYYVLAANDSSYISGEPKISANGWDASTGGVWATTTPTTLDTYFNIYAGGDSGSISDVSVGTAGVGDAWSYEINNSIVQGTMYCKIGSGNNKACNTIRPVPLQQPWPISDGNIEDWKAEALAGGSTSTVSINSSGIYDIGPIKINGDLSIGAGATLNLNGPVYVTGDISVGGNGLIRVNPALNSKSIVLISDGKISAQGGGAFGGSGLTGSYIFLITTSTCPNGAGCSNKAAVSVSGSTGAVVINAQKGTVDFSGGSGARQVTANKIIMGGSSTIVYETGLLNPTFSTGPSGSWKIDSWKEVE